MSAILKGHKRYFLEYENNQKICGSNKHIWGNANSINALKNKIKKIKLIEEHLNPCNFCIYDTQGELNENNFVPIVYYEK